MNTIERKLCIEASAGSGKTYNLAKRFIKLLSITNSNYIKPAPLPSITAITFTNKAAQEMKERIILFLKDLAEIKNYRAMNPDEFNITKEKALNFLFDIVKNYSDFNVTTIDSFMNKILKAFSSDLQINPDYEIFFDDDKIFLYAFERLITDKTNFPHLLTFLNSMLFVDESGFDGERILFRALEKYKNYQIETDTISYNEFETHIRKKFNIKATGFLNTKKELENIISNYAKILFDITEPQPAFDKRKIGIIKKAASNQLSADILKLQKIVEKNSTMSILRKNSFLPPEIEKDFLDFSKKLINTYKAYTLLKAIFYSHSTSQVIAKLINYENDIKNYLNIVKGSEISKLVKNKLQEDSGVPYAYCKIGEQISHFLIDEFQDTSHDQFEAIFPLIENAAAEGGSIYTVGDKKQAIYAWRGGDYKIFDTLNRKIEMNIEKLEKNYRSSKNIVEFNNIVFNPDNLSNNLIPKSKTSIPQPEKLSKEVKRIYSAVKQKVTQKNDGYVKVTIKNIQNDEKEDFYKITLIEELKALFKNKVNYWDIMILLRKKEDITKVVRWIKNAFPHIHIITEDALTLINNFEIKKLLLVATATIYPEDAAYKEILNELNLNINIFDLANKMRITSPYEFFSYLINLDFINSQDNELYLSAFMEKILELQKYNYNTAKIIEYFYENDDITVQLPANIQAMKIMTIHKSKGLEAHTVLIPFYDWNFVDTKKLPSLCSIDLSPILNIDKKAVVLVNSEVRAVSKDAESFYADKYHTTFIESLNLMYVANTRAEKNLIIIGAYKENSSTINAANVLYKLIDKKNSYTIGSINPSIHHGEESKNLIPVKYGNKITEHLKIYPEVYHLSTDFEHKLLGDLFHLAMSFIKTIETNSNVKELVNKAYQKAIKSINYENEEVILLMENAIADLKDYFFNIENVWNEKELIDKDGNIFRADRIVKKDGKIVIIDYKTGEPDYDKHTEQLKNYINLFKNAIGIIYYTKNREVKYV